MNEAFTVEQYADADGFLRATETWLLEAEAENNLLLGVALGQRGRAATDCYWATVRTADGLVGCAYRTPPHRMVLSRMPPTAAGTLAAHASAACDSLGGVNGPTESAERFADAWTAKHGGSWTTLMRLRIHKLTRVALAGNTRPGLLRKAAPADLDLARAWHDAYVRDTGLTPAASGAAERMIDRGGLYFWTEADAPCAMVAAGRETATGCAIYGVYTPPESRRRGYATAAVAALSDALLRGGRKFCCLYTDTANPTSNSIYAKIGYEPIRDDVEIAFRA